MINASLICGFERSRKKAAEELRVCWSCERLSVENDREDKAEDNKRAHFEPYSP